MAQVINTNSLSLITQNNINKNQSALSSSIERLSSGLRINSAKDDAAGQCGEVIVSAWWLCGGRKALRP